jgi:pimeloyl-ACP methyl ester carboxylesterase
MPSTTIAGNVSAATQLIDVGHVTYAYRRFGTGAACPLLCLQHFTGNLDNWDPAVTDPLASGREVILFDNAGVGRSSGTVPKTIGASACQAPTRSAGHISRLSLSRTLMAIAGSCKRSESVCPVANGRPERKSWMSPS